MEAERKADIEIFNAALEFDSPEERAQYVREVCTGNPGRQQRLDALLEAYEASDSLFGLDSTADEAIATEADLVPEGLGSKINRYKLLQQLGEGGMGTVYMAEQEEPVRRRVAFKIIKVGMDTRQVVARFEAERQALALMDHPNIAKVFDAGATTSGRPYFVMELVRGMRITDYCDLHSLSTGDRLALFGQVCDAIQHAHQKGIIHRDIKPSNVLVSLQEGKPVLKVIDFGIAKAIDRKLTEKTLVTEFHSLVGTPIYMSPEQAEMTTLDIDTRSDIYSLGVLLYELLTGLTPFDPEELLEVGLREMRRTLREQEPPRPSTRLKTMPAADLTTVARKRHADPPKLISLLRGDLDWIVMKALEKDRTRRYETAKGLGQDVDRYLGNQPVEARPPSAFYQFQKLVRRHRMAFVAGAGILLALLVGTAVSTWQALVATAAQVVAQEQKQRAEQGESEALHLLYTANMNLIQAAWEQNNITRVHDLLVESQDHPQRGFEWFYWQRQIHRELFTLRGHGHRVYRVAFSPDGRRLATCSGDGAVKLWDADTGRESLTVNVTSKGVWCVAFSPDGQRFVTGNIEGTPEIWDATTGRRLLSLTGETDPTDSVAAFSPDGRRIVTGAENGSCKVWDAATGAELLDLSVGTEEVCDAVFSPDGRRIVTGGMDQIARVWDATSGAELLELKGHTNGILCASFSPDGQRIATGSIDRTARIWNANTGDELMVLDGHDSWVYATKFVPDGSRMVTGSADRTAKVWDAASGEELTTFKGHTHWIYSMDISPDGRKIITGSRDGTAKVWDLARDHQPVRIHDKNLSAAAALSPDGDRIVTGGVRGKVRVWEASTSKEIAVLSGPTDHIWSVSFGPDGKRVLAGSEDGTATVWDAASGRTLLQLKGHEDGIPSAMLSANGQKIVTGSMDGTAKIWDASNGAELMTLRGHTSLVAAVAFSPDGQQVVTGGYDFTAIAWEVASGREQFRLDGHTNPIRTVAYSPDGKWIVTGSWDWTAKLWNAADGRELRTFEGHRWGIMCIAFSPDGKRIVTGTRDGKVKLWDIATGRELLTLNAYPNSECGSVAFSPDGRRILSCGYDKGVAEGGSVKIWQVASPTDVEAWQEAERSARPPRR